MNKFKQFLKGSLALALLATLAACGGGGGGGSSAPDPTPVTATGNITASASSCVVQQDQSTCSVSVTTSSTNASNPRVTNTAGATVSTAANGTFPASVKVGGDTFTFTFGGTAPKSVAVGGSCVPGTNPDATGTCKAPTSWWPPATITPAGVQVFGANQLPAGCNRWADQCWRDSVANGTVKFIATPATGPNPRTVVMAYFRNTSTAFGVTGLWNVLPIYADDGSLAASDISGGIASEVDWISGSSNGAILHEKGSGLCSELYYFAPGSTWSTRQVTCPF